MSVTRHPLDAPSVNYAELIADVDRIIEILEPLAEDDEQDDAAR